MSISHIIRKEHGIQYMSCYSHIISEIPPEIHTMEKFDFLKSIIHSRIIQVSANNGLTKIKE